MHYTKQNNMGRTPFIKVYGCNVCLHVYETLLDVKPFPASTYPSCYKSNKTRTQQVYIHSVMLRIQYIQQVWICITVNSNVFFSHCNIPLFYVYEFVLSGVGCTLLTLTFFKYFILINVFCVRKGGNRVTLHPGG